MKPIASFLVIAVLTVALSACSSSGGGGGGNGSSLAITTTSANFAVAGNPYASTLVATGGTPPYTWAVVSGLPAWASLNTATGVLTGTPATSDVGNFNPTFRVADTTGATKSGTVLLAVHNRTDILSVDNSTPPVPGGAASSSPSISNDGRFVAFVSMASNLVPGVGGSQIYLHDWQTNQTSLISRDSGVAINAGNGISSAPSISSDGHFVAFVSNSTNLVSGVSGQQIYLRDVQTGATTLVSKDNFNNPANGLLTTSPSISNTGRFIAYVSNATNLVAGVLGGQQIYLYDTQITMALPNGQTTLVSKDNSLTPLPGDGASSAPSISQDGCFVAFASLSTNLVSPPPGSQQVYVRGPLPGPGTCGLSEQTTLISKDNSTPPIPGNGASSSPSINSTGSFVTFTSVASNLLAGISGQQIYLDDRNNGPNGTTSLISKDNSGVPVQGNSSSSVPSISQDGCFVAFASLSTNFGVAGGNQQIYVRGPLPGPGTCGVPELTSLVSKDNSAVPVSGNAASDTPSVNANGGFVAFSSLSTNFGVAGGNQQIFVRAMP